MWKESGEVETIEADPRPFQVDSNFVEAQLYNKDVKPVSYKMILKSPLLRPKQGARNGMV